MKKKLICFCLTLLMIFSFISPSFAATQTVEKYLGCVKTTCYQEMWHYSGGYWKLEPDTDFEETITDAEISCALNIVGTLRNRYTRLALDLPTGVQSAIAEGEYVTFNVTNSSILLSDLFDVDSFYGYIEDSQLVLYAKPKLNLCGLRCFDDFVAGLNVILPLVDYDYGNNLYSIFKSSAYKGMAKGGYYMNETKKTIIKYFVHPYMVKDSTGAMRGSYQMKLNDKTTVYTTGYYVGNGTFRDGGAVGCRFTYPFAVEFRSYHTEIVDDSPSDPVIVPPSDEDDEELQETPSAVWKIHRKK